MDNDYDYLCQQLYHFDNLCQQLDRHGWLLVHLKTKKKHHHQLMDFFPLVLLVDDDQ
jgi:hypothetical protein